jgi:alpha-beta hydrolase superfamily lysophospholipase
MHSWMTRCAFRNLSPRPLRRFFAAGTRLSDPTGLRKIRADLPVYLFSGSDDPVGLQLEGVRTLIERYRQAGLREISHHFYPGGRHEMLNEINRNEVVTNLLVWICELLQKQKGLSDRATHPNVVGAR